MCLRHGLKAALRFTESAAQTAVAEIDLAFRDPSPSAMAQPTNGIQLANQPLRVALSVRLRGGLHSQKQPRLRLDALALLRIAQPPVKIVPADLALCHGGLVPEVQVLHDALRA